MFFISRRRRLTYCAGAFWLAFGATQTPSFNAEAYFTSGAKTAAEEAAALKGFYASFGKRRLFAQHGRRI
jgi:hypothetical protein